MILSSDLIKAILTIHFPLREGDCEVTSLMRHLNKFQRFFLTTVSLCLFNVTAEGAASSGRPPAIGGLSDARIIVVRHAEKMGHGTGLSAAGKLRAQIYAAYFLTLKVQGQPIHINSLVAATDTSHSERPRLTLLPLSVASGLPIQQPCSDRNPTCMVDWLKHRPAGQTTLISWRHSKIPRLLKALAVSHGSLFPDGHWPPDFFDWIVVIKFDHGGHVQPNSVALIREPDSINDAVWRAMDHPTIRPFDSSP